MKQYHDLLRDILDNGESREDRTGVGTISVFGRQMRFDLTQGFPAMTTKKLAWKACVGELLWFLEGSNDERRLAEITHGTRDNVTTIWTPNANAPYWKDKAKFEGDLGRVYGVQWRTWMTTKLNWLHSDHSDHSEPLVIDQINNVIKSIKNDPTSRRHIVSAWNVGELSDMALPPCHVMFQFYVTNDGGLSCQMYQRSQDVYLGAPFNYASYALLTHMIAQVTGLTAKELIVVSGDTHLYTNHLSQVKELLTRTPHPLPKLWLNPEITDINKFTMSDIKLVDYVCHGALPAPMAV